jgi:hypothetical protein
VCFDKRLLKGRKPQEHGNQKDHCDAGSLDPVPVYSYWV